MNAKGWMMFNALVAQFHSTDKDSVMALLSDEEGQEAGKHQVGSGHLKELLASAEDSLSTIHYSWLLPAIRKFDPALQPYFLNSLPSRLQKRIRRLTDESWELAELSPAIRHFFNHALFHRVSEEDILPLPFVKEGELQQLLSLSKKELITVIDLVGIPDLAAEIRQLIDQKLVKSVVRGLNTIQKSYLQLALKSGVPQHSEHLPLHGLNGDQKKMERLLHRKGLLCLGKALAGRDRSFLWHITHTLDAGRAQILTRYLTNEEPPEAIASSASQVMAAIQFLKTSGH